MLDLEQPICNFPKKMGFAARRVWGRVGAAAVRAVLVGVVLWGVTSPALAGIGGSAFSEDEWRKLESGELVSRRQTSRRDGLDLIGGSSWQVIDAPPDLVWRALLDTNHYPRMMPQVLEAKLIEKREGQRTVFVRQGQKGIAEKKYYLHVQIHEAKRDITFAVDEQRPHDLRAAWGFYTVRPYKQDRTLLAYGILADLGGGIFESVFETQIHDWMLKTPWMVKRFVEGSGRKLYENPPVSAAGSASK